MLNGIDASGWQGVFDLSAVHPDFIIEKATGGTGYVNPDCDPEIQQAIKDSIRKGVYHMRDDGYGYSDPVAEADFFVNNITGYLDGHTLLMLDWEIGDLSQVHWARLWLDHVFARTGVRPVIYMSESVVNAHDWTEVVQGDYGLVVAKYSTSEPNIQWWPFYIAWQFTSTGHLNGYNGNLDEDHFYGDAKVWDAYCAPVQAAPAAAPTPEPAPTPAPEPTPAPVPDPGTVVTPDPVTPPAPEVNQTPVSVDVTPPNVNKPVQKGWLNQLIQAIIKLALAIWNA